MFPGFDPSKLDPKMIQEISELVRTLPPEQIMRMQSLMHNQLAGYASPKEVAEMESALPPEFRQKMAEIMYRASAAGAFTGTASPAAATPSTPAEPAKPISSVDEARLTVLRAVKEGKLSPEDALKALFT
jgi:hypothetical protein